MLDKTPFYATSGGQSGDIGALEDNKHIVLLKILQNSMVLNLFKNQS